MNYVSVQQAEKGVWILIYFVAHSKARSDDYAKGAQDLNAAVGQGKSGSHAAKPSLLDTGRFSVVRWLDGIWCTVST